MVKRDKMKHKIHTKQEAGEPVCRDYRKLIKRAVQTTLRYEQVDSPCAVSVLITDDEGIRRYNAQYRKKDKATDVLSFPMQEFKHPGWDGIAEKELDLVSELLPLGDIIISTEMIERQASEHGNSTRQETALMIIHSTLHLLGYDHNDDDSEREMRTKEIKLSRAPLLCSAPT